MSVDITKIITFVLILIMGLWVAVKTFNNRQIGRNKRFALSMAVLVILIAFLFMTFTRSNLVFLATSAVILIMFAVCAPTVWRGIKHAKQERRQFIRVEVVAQMYAVLNFQRRGIVELSPQSVNKIHVFLGRVSEPHRKLALKFVKEALSDENARDEMSAMHTYNDKVVDTKIEQYWQKYND